VASERVCEGPRRRHDVSVETSWPFTGWEEGRPQEEERRFQRLRQQDAAAHTFAGPFSTTPFSTTPFSAAPFTNAPRLPLADP
jgi:hypothetical protein